MLDIKKIPVNMLEENCYVVSDDTREAVVIDCGALTDDDRRRITDYIEDRRLQVRHHLCTHMHYDHHETTRYFRDTYGAQTCLPQLEADIAELDDPDEKAMFMEELGLQQSGLARLIQCSYELLGLISFLTAGADECRAWTIKKGTKAPQAAGKIHSDFERGFIRAEVIAFDDLKACGTLANAKAKGLLRSEGKEYIMHDGDVVNFLFNV